MGMNKEEMAKILNDNGFPADVENGVLYVHKALTAAEVRQLNALYRQYGYNESHGHRLKAGEEMEVPPLSLSMQRRQMLTRKGRRKRDGG